MHSLSFTYKGKPCKFRAPGNWNELTARELIRWAAVVYSDLTDGDRVRLALAIMYNIPAKILALFPEYLKVQIAPTIAFVFEDNKLTRWVYPKFKIGFRGFYGPADALTNLTANEFFNYTEVLYQQWLLKKDEDTLTALCAVLYRQKRRDEVTDDIRVPLTDAGISLRATRFAALHVSVKLAILLNYEGCRGFIIKNNPDIFNSKGGSKSNRVSDLVLALSNGPFGDYNTTSGANLYKFLEHMTRVISDAEKLKSA